MKLKNKIILITVVFLSNFFLDRITKILAENYLQGKNSISLLGNFVILTFVKNDGAFLSAGSSFGEIIKLFVFIIIPGIICLFGLYYCIYKESDKLSIILIVSIIAGGLGNIYDRLFNNGYVTDFLNFGIGNLRTGILNIADISITFGAIILLLYEMAKTKKNKNNEETEISC